MDGGQDLARTGPPAVPGGPARSSSRRIRRGMVSPSTNSTTTKSDAEARRRRPRATTPGPARRPVPPRPASRPRVAHPTPAPRGDHGAARSAGTVPPQQGRAVKLQVSARRPAGHAAPRSLRPRRRRRARAPSVVRSPSSSQHRVSARPDATDATTSGHRPAEGPRRYGGPSHCAWNLTTSTCTSWAPSPTSTRACTSTSSTRTAGLGGFFRLGNRANEGTGEMTACLYLPDGRVGLHVPAPRGHHERRLRRRRACASRWSSPSRSCASPTRARSSCSTTRSQMADPRAAFTVQPARRRARSTLTYTRASPRCSAASPTSRVERPGEEFARGHYEQLVAATGTHHRRRTSAPRSTASGCATTAGARATGRRPGTTGG